MVSLSYVLHALMKYVGSDNGLFINFEVKLYFKPYDSEASFFPLRFVKESTKLEGAPWLMDLISQEVHLGVVCFHNFSSSLSDSMIFCCRIILIKLMCKRGLFVIWISFLEYKSRFFFAYVSFFLILLVFFLCAKSLWGCRFRFTIMDVMEDKGRLEVEFTEV